MAPCDSMEDESCCWTLSACSCLPSLQISRSESKKRRATMTGGRSSPASRSNTSSRSERACPWTMVERKIRRKSKQVFMLITRTEVVETESFEPTMSMAEALRYTSRCGVAESSEMSQLSWIPGTISTFRSWSRPRAVSTIRERPLYNVQHPQIPGQVDSVPVCSHLRSSRLDVILEEISSLQSRESSDRLQCANHTRETEGGAIPGTLPAPNIVGERCSQAVKNDIDYKIENYYEEPIADSVIFAERQPIISSLDQDTELESRKKRARRYGVLFETTNVGVPRHHATA